MNTSIEIERQVLQKKIDSSKSKLERNKLGQYSTPFLLADDIIRASSSYIKSLKDIHFLDPAFGTGVFYSALQKNINKDFYTTGFEIDEIYAKASLNLWTHNNINIQIDDFFNIPIPSEQDKFNLIICNPPYVRHHHLTKEQKQNIKDKTRDVFNVNISGLAGLYCYFLAYSLKWMQEDGIGIWLIPSEFLDVNYGGAIKNLLLENVNLLRIHTFDPENQQFEDALVSSTIIWFKKSTDVKNETFLYTYGGTPTKPLTQHKIVKADLDINSKWSKLKNGLTKTSHKYTLGQIFKSKRGLATGDNKFFILSEADIIQHNISSKYLNPILPSPRYLKQNIIEKDRRNIEKKLFLLNVNLSIEEAQKDISLWNYLKTGLGTTSNKYLCKSRKIWYLQEKREVPSLFVTYMGRSENNTSPFRFILNNSNSIANNSYIYLYPKFHLEQNELNKIWEYLNKIPSKKLISEGRSYGGGLHKLEPKELLNIEIDTIINKLPNLKEKILQTE